VASYWPNEPACKYLQRRFGHLFSILAGTGRFEVIHSKPVGSIIEYSLEYLHGSCCYERRNEGAKHILHSIRGQFVLIALIREMLIMGQKRAYFP